MEVTFVSCMYSVYFYICMNYFHVRWQQKTVMTVGVHWLRGSILNLLNDYLQEAHFFTPAIIVIIFSWMVNVLVLLNFCKRYRHKM
jgi:hypothetical protein